MVIKSKVYIFISDFKFYVPSLFDEDEIKPPYFTHIDKKLLFLMHPEILDAQFMAD